jgi:hypothetical protein
VLEDSGRRHLVEGADLDSPPGTDGHEGFPVLFDVAGLEALAVPDEEERGPVVQPVGLDEGAQRPLAPEAVL